MTAREQKLVSFLDNTTELDKIAKEMQEGWSIVSLMRNGNYYAGIMEKLPKEEPAEGDVFIPARKKFTIIS
ncbi:MAG: hypothetical protein DGJ47_000075 [Rickettsiaceae bacterium]